MSTDAVKLLQSSDTFALDQRRANTSLSPISAQSPTGSPAARPRTRSNTTNHTTNERCGNVECTVVEVEGWRSDVSVAAHLPRVANPCPQGMLCWKRETAVMVGIAAAACLVAIAVATGGGDGAYMHIGLAAAGTAPAHASPTPQLPT